MKTIKFLIIQTAFPGDVVLATPIIEKLIKFYPDAVIDFLLRKGNEGLLQGHPHLRQLLLLDKKNNKYYNIIRHILQIRKEKYDYIINIHRFASSGILAFLSKAKTKIGFTKNPFSFSYDIKVKHEIGTGKHEVQRNLELIGTITDNTFQKPVLYPSVKDYELTAQYKQTAYICIAPASIWFTKQFPVEKWAELIMKSDKKYSVYLLGSRQDKDLCDHLVALCGIRNVINLAGKLSFLGSAALMRDAEMNYVNDSAPMHIASAMNARVTAIFCSTVPAFGFGPVSDFSNVVETNEQLSCRPCGLHGLNTCPEKHFKCALSIKIEQLIF